MTIDDWAHRIARGFWREDTALQRHAWPIGPRNTWSNIGYLVAGWAAVPATHADPRAWIFAGAMTLLAAGSFAYHGWKTLLANALDWAGMYAVLWIVVLTALGVRPSTPGILGLIGGSCGAAVFGLWRRARFDLAMAIGFGIGCAVAVTHGYGVEGAVAAAVFIVSYLCWTDDKASDPIFGLWGHALWHLGCAFALFLLFVGIVR